MKINPESLTKRYYSIGEIAKMFDVNTSLLRYWESVFDELKPNKTKGGKRRYVKEDVLLIQDIHTLVKVQGHTLEGAHDGLKKMKNLKKVRLELSELKSDMINLKSQLDSSQKSG